MSIELDLESESTPIAHLQHRSSALCFPSCFASRRRSIWWERLRSTSFSPPHSTPTTTTTADRWWSRGLTALRKLRDWSEIVAGPRWKTFIRKFNHNRASKRVAKFQYDPLSYALNFDEGPGQNEDCQDEAFRDFSSRYAAVNVKSVAPEPDCNGDGLV